MLTHFAASDFLFWYAQIILEASGAYWSFRKSLWPLNGYLCSRLLFDLITLFASRSEAAYQLVFWVARPVEYMFLAILAVACAAEMVREAPQTIKTAAVIVGSSAMPLIVLCYLPLNYGRMLTVETWINLILALALIVGLMTERGKAPWTAIAWGVALLAGVDCSVDYLVQAHQAWWHVVARLRNLEIAPLILWLWAAKSWQGFEFRQGLGVKIVEAEKVKGVAE